jgi:hypothetical protein
MQQVQVYIQTLPSPWLTMPVPDWAAGWPLRAGRGENNKKVKVRGGVGAKSSLGVLGIEVDLHVRARLQAIQLEDRALEGGLEPMDILERFR